MSLFLRPVTVKFALPFVERVHRRLPKLRGGMWSVGVQEDGRGIVGIAVVGRPTAKFLQDGRRLQVLRVAVLEGQPNACSMLYGACSRAARAMGATDLFTYIHEDEHGASLKASGWIFDEEFFSKGGSWDRPSRPRGETAEPEPKRRWFAPWSEMVKKEKPHVP